MIRSTLAIETDSANITQKDRDTLASIPICNNSRIDYILVYIMLCVAPDRVA